jgi:hypothetical protein
LNLKQAVRYAIKVDVYAGYEFYLEPCLAQVLCQTALANLEGLPDFRSDI